MALSLFSPGKFGCSDDPDKVQELLEQWLSEFLPVYFESSEYKKLSKANQKAGGEWFSMFMEFFQGYIGGDLKRLNKADVREIMLDLFPRKVICSDSQAKTIVPEILAVWQFLDRSFNSGKIKKLKHAPAVIKFLTSIKKDYLETFNRRPSGLEQLFMENPEGVPEELQQLLKHTMGETSDRFEDDDWVVELIEDTLLNLNQVESQPQPPEAWFALLNYPELSQFLRHICIYGYDDEKPETEEVVTALMTFALQNLFMKIRQREQGAINFWQETESNILSAIELDELAEEGMKVLVFALSQYKQFLSEEFMAGIQHWLMENADEQPEESLTPEMMEELLKVAVAEAADEFILLTILKEQLGFLPTEGMEMILSIMVEAGDKAVDALTLMLLDHNHEQAQVAASVLEENVSRLTGLSLSRLIRTRNWFDASVQPTVDALIRKARKAEIVPEALKASAAPTVVETRMSCVDGSGAQGVMVVIKDQSRFRLISFVLKEQVGVVDAFVTPPTSRTEINGYLKLAGSGQAVMEKVSTDLVIRQLPLFINLNKTSGIVIDHELVQVMEFLNVEDWHPDTKTLSELYNSELNALPSEDEIAEVQKRSRRWTSSAIGESWFEDSDQFNALRPLTYQRYHQAFELVMEPARQQWGERYDENGSLESISSE